MPDCLLPAAPITVGHPAARLPTSNEDRRVYARSALDSSSEQTQSTTLDDTDAWLLALNADGPEHDAAVTRLHGLLLRAARHEVSRRRATLAHVRSEELDDLAVQSADDALMAVLAKLGDFRRESRFTTWAYKFALFEAGVKLRRRAWQGREVVLEPDAWKSFADNHDSAHVRLERSELLDALREAIDETLTPHQRRVFIALALNEVPIDVLAGRLRTTRGALYKTLHDARRRLRSKLEADGHVEPPRTQEARP